MHIISLVTPACFTTAVPSWLTIPNAQAEMVLRQLAQALDPLSGEAKMGTRRGPPYGALDPRHSPVPQPGKHQSWGKKWGGGVSAPCPCLAVPGSPEVTDLPIVIRWPKWSQNPGSSGWTLQSHWHRPWWEWLLLSSQILRGLRPP